MTIRFTRLPWIPLALLAGLARFPLVADEAPKPDDGPKVHARLLLSDLEPVRDRDARRAELFYAAVRAEWERAGWGARAEIRAKDGRFRPYFTGDVWLEEGYAFAATPAGEVRIGKLERGFGLDDDTFGGTLFSRNGVTRNPDWGAGLTGGRRLSHDELEWSLLYLGRNDKVAWEEDGRGVESDPAASLRDEFQLRAAYTVDEGLWRLKPGISFASGRIVRDAPGTGFRRTDAAIDVTAFIPGLLSVSLEGLYRDGESASGSNPAARLAYDGAWAGLVAVKAELPNVTYRYSYTEWRYRGADSNERQHLISASWRPRRGIEGTLEYGARRLRLPAGARADNALRFGLTLSF